MAISSTNILIIWLSLELNLFSFIPLLINKSKINEIEASINYFLSQALASILFLARIVIMLNLHWQTKIIFLLLNLSLLLKLGIAPCHYWFLIVIEKIRWINCLIMSTWQKIAPLFIIAYIIKPRTFIRTIIACLNVATGSILGLRQLSLKKILACSSITHMGWATGRLIIKLPCLLTAYFLLYIIIVFPLFLIINKTDKQLLNNSWHKLPNSLKLSTIILLLSLRGLPPLTGFFPKLLIISYLAEYSITAITIIVFRSVLSLFFYINIILNIFIAIQNSLKEKKSKTTLNLVSLSLRTSLLGLILITL